MGIKSFLVDPRGVLDNWDDVAVDPCSWNMVTCSNDGLVISLGAPSQNLSGILAPSIGNLTNLQLLHLQNNNISGNIPSELGRPLQLHTLDVSNFSGQIPTILSHLESLQYLRLNYNSLSGTIPSWPAMQQVTSSSSPSRLASKQNQEQRQHFVFFGSIVTCFCCHVTCNLLLNHFLFLLVSKPSGKPKSHKIVLAFGSSLGCICLLVLGFGLFLCWRQRHNQQIFFDVNEQHREEVCLGNCTRFHFKELQVATNNFSSKKLVPKGGFGKVYKRSLQDGTVVAVKRLKDGNVIGDEIQFQTEVAMISLSATERLLVYPYISNLVNSKLGAHCACTSSVIQMIIHRDVKAANILLDDYYEAIVGDFGLANLLDHWDSHVTTAVRGTVGHIAPEYLSTSQSSEKIDVFRLGILLLELISGLRALEFRKTANQNVKNRPD
ncbi:hypothetical protein J1N35_026655 [Gossypium stocksii]|uniref:Protein kinase domain-containing protein n=1 Tax=Gossypium stocksii TaxID=47602 RepID=A0A9D3ZYD6_9ROSI|nr:hypothetical protein J1N35_026655 [Gossypium stocksii]